MSKIDELLQARTTAYTFTVLHTLLDASGLIPDLEGNHALTLFAPPDAVFSALRTKTPSDLVKDTFKLQQLLTFHIVPLRLTRADLRLLLDQQMAAAATADQRGAVTLQLETLTDFPLHVTLTDSRFQVEGACILQADIPADNGIIHIIDQILWPPGLQETSFSAKVPFHTSENVS